MNDEKTRLVEERQHHFRNRLECIKKPERNRKWESRKKRNTAAEKMLDKSQNPLILCDKLKL